MTDTPWETPSPTAAEPAPPRQKRQARRTRDKALEAAGMTADAPKAAGRKPRVEREAPDTIKVTLSEYAEMKVGPARKEFVKIHKIMSALPALARSKVLAELQKVFG